MTNEMELVAMGVISDKGCVLENRTMKDSTLDKAMLDALAFLRAARALRSARKRGEGVRVASGAAQRASMDLTRRLADLRQGR